MTHPSHEEWMSVLYGEADGEKSAQLHKHLRTCPECQTTVAAWRGTMTALDAFKVPSVRHRQVPATFGPGFLKWGLAALFILGIGLGLGRFAKPANDQAEQLALLSQIRMQLREEFKTDLQAALATTDHGATNEFRRAVRTAFMNWAANQSVSENAEVQQLVAALTDSMVSGRA